MTNSLARRHFLKAIGLGIAAPLVLPATVLGRGPRPAPSNRVAIGLVGCGGMGFTDLRNMMALPGVEVRAVCDVDKAHRDDIAAHVMREQATKLDYQAPDCAACNEFERVLERDDIDAVIIATPDHWHAGIAIAAAKAGKDIYGEKPLARTIVEGRDMIRVVRRHGRVFQMGTQTRSSTAVQRIVDLVRNGAIGNIERVEAYIPQYGGGGVVSPQPVPEGFDYDRWLGPAPWAPYQAERCHGFFRVVLDYSGGTITDHGTHRLDVAKWGANKEHEWPVRIEGEGQFPRDGLYDAVTVGRFELTYADGVKFVAMTEPDIVNWGVCFFGDEGWIRVPMEAPLPHRPITASDPRILAMPLRPDQRVTRPSDNHWANFIDCVRTRSEPVQPIESGHVATALPHLGNIAMELGRAIDFDPATGRFINDDEANAKLDRPKRQPWARFFEA